MTDSQKTMRNDVEAEVQDDSQASPAARSELGDEHGRGGNGHGKARRRFWRSGRPETISPAVPPAHVRQATTENGAETEVHEVASAVAVRRRDAIYRRSLALADLLAAVVALGLGVVVLGGDSLTWKLALAVPLVVLVSKVAGLYDRDGHLIHKTTLEEAPALFQVATLYTLLLWLFESVLVVEGAALATGDDLGREQVVGIWGLLFVSMLVSRAGARKLAGRLAATERCLVLGGGSSAGAVEKKLNSARGRTATVVGRVPLESANGDHEGPQVLGALSDLPTILDEHSIHRVIIAPTTADSEQLLDAIRRVKALGVKVSVLPRVFEVVGSSVKFDDVEGLMLLGVPRYGLSSSSRLLKRGMDIVASAAGLVFLAPLFAAVAAVVKLSSPGPAVFRQTRIGRDGKEFQMLKFRTMVDGADEQKADLFDLNEADGLFKIADDPRLTEVGRVLRRFSLDELPQLVNVLLGEMSLVGPRPLVPEDDHQIEGWQRRRLEISPGMTGIWQVLGSTRVPLNEMVKIDYLYGANWSLWLDMKILLRTIPHVLARRGL